MTQLWLSSPKLSGSVRYWPETKAIVKREQLSPDFKYLHSKSVLLSKLSAEAHSILHGSLLDSPNLCSNPIQNTFSEYMGIQSFQNTPSLGIN